MGIIFTSPLPCGPPQSHIAVAPCLAIVEVIYKASPSATQVVGGDILTIDIDTERLKRQISYANVLSNLTVSLHEITGAIG